MTAQAQRRPAALSGGQQQRVALARALVLNPSVLLLDEPLGALDARLRKHLQVELKTLQQSVGITFVYVTHDQEEALTMSDRLAVMNDGRVEQVGPPEQVYTEPSSAYVAGFLGSANLIEVEVLDAGTASGPVRCQVGALPLLATGSCVRGAAKVVVRPERVTLTPELTSAPRGDNTFTGLVDRVTYLGPLTHVVVRLADGQTLLAAVPNSGGKGAGYSPGTAVQATFDADAARLLQEDDSAIVDLTDDAGETAPGSAARTSASAAAGGA
jgi:spermidine/putrescine transport system ATP-binding protein